MKLLCSCMYKEQFLKKLHDSGKYMHLLQERCPRYTILYFPKICIVPLISVLLARIIIYSYKMCRMDLYFIIFKEDNTKTLENYSNYLIQRKGIQKLKYVVNVLLCHAIWPMHSSFINDVFLS